MKKSSKQLKLTRQTVRRLSSRDLDGVRGGDDDLIGEPVSDCYRPGTYNCPYYTSACAQSNHCML